MERQPADQEPSKPAHVFLSPEVIEVHLSRGEPIPAGTAKLMWVLQLLFEDN